MMGDVVAFSLGTENRNEINEKINYFFIKFLYRFKNFVFLQSEKIGFGM